MATTTILDIGTTAAYSNDITVTEAAPVTIGLIAGGSANDSLEIPYGISLPIERECTVGGAFVDSGFRLQTGVNETGSGPVVRLVGNGVYRVKRPVTDFAVGVNQD